MRDTTESLTGVATGSALRTGALSLAALDPIDAAVDARRLLLFAMAAEALELVTNPERKLTADEAARFAAALERRAAGEPVSRIVGRRGFYGREFLVTEATLDPRPDSECLITAALELVARDWPRGRGLKILDIGAGSGCLLLTLLAELPFAVGIGVDPSADALSVCSENAMRLGLADRCSWVCGRGFAGLAQDFGLVVSNPPYIPTHAIGDLDREVRLFDPHLALDGGADGLDIYRAIAAESAVCRSEKKSWTIFEVGHDQAIQVKTIFATALNLPLESIRTYLDMAGVQRCVALRIQN